MGPESVAAIISGLVALVVAAGGILTNRSRRIVRSVAELETQTRDALRHIHRLEMQVSGLGGDPPPRPTSLSFDNGGAR